jgi:hypothetical protein
MARETARDERLDTHELTAAQSTLPFGTRFARDERRYRKIRDGSGNPVCCVAAAAFDVESAAPMFGACTHVVQRGHRHPLLCYGRRCRRALTLRSSSPP